MSLLLALTLAAFGAPPSSPQEQRAVGEAKAAVKALATSLQGQVKTAMQAGGPPSAIAACNAQAGPTTVAIGDQHAVTVGRSSLRLRNPAQNAAPDWVDAWLKDAGERPAAGLSPMVDIAETPDGPVVRFLTPITVGAPCLACHGDADTLSAAVTAELAERYPDDKAVGYAAGDLRGVMWAVAPVPAD